MSVDSGKIALDADMILYRSRFFGEWDLPLGSLRLFGEMTNENGPFIDDYFLCFAASPGEWFEASFYAEGRDTFLDCLSRKLGTPLKLHLTGATDFASRVIWPEHLAGGPMFRFIEIPPKGWGRHLRGIGAMRIEFAEPVLHWLKSNPVQRTSTNSSNVTSSWTVFRVDDNGNVFEVRRQLSKQEADQLVAEMESRGHKQMYWAECR